MSRRRPERAERADRDWLEDIDAAARLIAQRVSQGKARFLADQERQDSIVRRLEIVGEAVGGLSRRLRERHDEVPWKDIVAFRNKVIHHYFGLDLEVVWHVASIDTPVIHEQVRQILAREPERDLGAPGGGRPDTAGFESDL